MTTQTLDKLYLELSQFVNARNERELKALNRARYALDKLSGAKQRFYLNDPQERAEQTLEDVRQIINNIIEILQ